VLTQSKLIAAIVRLVKKLLRFAPRLALKVLKVAFSPREHLQQLALVSTIQLLAFSIKRVRSAFRRGLLRPNLAVERQHRATTFEEWRSSQVEIEQSRREGKLSSSDRAYFDQLRERAENYAALQAAGDEYGLMFHLRSELMRKQAGGGGYSRNGSMFLRKNHTARRLIEEYQTHVCAALRYVATGSEGSPFSLAQRLAFINETRHAFGRTALLLSGGGAFGVKHLGVVAELHKQRLLPRIVSGTSAGSIVAGMLGVKTSSELSELLEGGQVTKVVEKLTFFGLRRGVSGVGVDAMEQGRKSAPVEWDVRRGTRYLTQAKNLLDSTVLSDSIVDLFGGEITFLEAFDRTGVVLCVTVTRADAKAPPLLCNYLTTPQMLVHSAVIASCAIPGVFEAVELMAMDRHGRIVPYFKTGGFRWTDGGLQADLPKQRLTELFNVNQFIVSQVNPLAPLLVPPADVGLPLIGEVLRLLKHQLVGLVAGASQLCDGTLVRPFGLRGVDLILQEYEGHVTIYPRWSLPELGGFLSNFDCERVAAFIRDGEVATWPHVALIRSLCEIEFTLDEVAGDLGRRAAAARRHEVSGGEAAGVEAAGVEAAGVEAAGVEAAVPGEEGCTGTSGPYDSSSPRRGSTQLRGKLPSYISLSSYGQPLELSEAPSAVPRSSSKDGMQKIASSASLYNLTNLTSLG